jgi:predicted enzyme related to lactoylglutathione lyase
MGRAAAAGVAEMMINAIYRAIRRGIAVVGLSFPVVLGGCEAQGPAASNLTGDVKPVLYVVDVESAVPFYRDVLGFEFLGFSNADGEPYYAEMRAGSLKFGLHDPMNAEQESWIGHQRIYFRVRDVGHQRAHVLSQGGLAGEITETDWMDMFIVRDPDGHQIVFAATDPAKHSVDPW